MESKLIAIIKDVLGVASLSLEDSPETLPEWDSFAQLVIFTRIKNELKINVNDLEMLRFHSVNSILILINSDAG